MSRSAIPSRKQFEKLIELIEEKRWLATGHARTNHARDRTRGAWQDIANKLNSDGRGCLKTWQQWAKYWKDKKAALKKKVSQMRVRMLQIGGADGIAENIILSTLEERMAGLLGGDGFAIGDRDLEINPFFNPTNNLTPNPEMPSEEIDEETIQVPIAAESPLSQSIIQNLDITQPMNDARLTNSATESVITPEPGPSWRADIEPPLHSHMQDLAEERSSNQREARNDSVASTPRRRRARASRRRLRHRTLPAQRNSQIVRLTERFMAIEERRVETERLLARSQEAMVHVLRDISVAFQELVAKVCHN